MRLLGIAILIVGILIGIYALSMDISVQVNYTGNSYGMPDRVNNLGLMNDRQNFLIVAGTLSIIGTIILIFKKSNKLQVLPYETAIGKAKVPEQPNIIINEERIEMNPLETLRKLKEAGLITDSEYDEKHTSIRNKEKEDDLISWSQIIDNRVNKKAQPLIELVKKAKNERLISEQEFEAEKKEIVDKCYSEVTMQGICINTDSYSRLSQPKKDKVEMYLETISDSDLIVLHHNKIKIIENQKWQDFVNQNDTNFEIIFQSKLN